MKNPWPIALTILIVGAFAFATFIAVTMIRQKVELVAPDYYAQDLQHEERMAREQRARALTNPLRVNWQAEPAAVVVTYPAPGVTGTIKLYRPSDLTLDRNLTIQPDADTRQVIPADTLASGPWKVQVAWQLDGVEYYQTESLVAP
jgi:hypothetical protein